MCEDPALTPRVRVRLTGNSNKRSWKVHGMSGFLGQEQHYIPAISGCGQNPNGQLSSGAGFRQ